MILLRENAFRAERTQITTANAARISVDDCCSSMTSCGYMALVILSVFLGTIDRSQEGCLDFLERQDLLRNSTLITLIRAKDSKEIINCTVERGCNKNDSLMCNIRDTCFGSDEPNLNKTCQNKSLGNDRVPLSHFMCLMAKIFNHPIKECGDYGIVCKLYSGISSPNSFPGQPSLLQTSHTSTTPRVINITDPVPEMNITSGQRTLLPSTRAPTTPQAKSSTMQQTNISDNIKPVSSGNEAEPEKALKSLLAISLGLNIILPVVVYLYMCHQRRIERSHSVSTSNNVCEATTSLTFIQENLICI